MEQISLKDDAAVHKILNDLMEELLEHHELKKISEQIRKQFHSDRIQEKCAVLARIYYELGLEENFHFIVNLLGLYMVQISTLKNHNLKIGKVDLSKTTSETRH